MRKDEGLGKVEDQESVGITPAMTDAGDASRAGGLGQRCSEGRDYALHLIRESKKRWDNRLKLEGLSLIEKYREGRIRIVIEFNPIGIKFNNYLAVCEAAGGVPKSEGYFDNHVVETLAVTHSEPFEPHNRPDRDDDVVFV